MRSTRLQYPAAMPLSHLPGLARLLEWRMGSKFAQPQLTVGVPLSHPPRSDSCAGTEDDIEDGVAEGYCGVPPSPSPSIYSMHSISNNAPLLSLLTRVLMTNLSLIRTMHTLY